MSPSHGDIEQEEKWIASVTNYQAPRALLDQVIMDYLVREGFKEAATNFASEANVTPPPYDTSLMDQQTSIRGAVESGDVPRAMELVNDLDPEILDTNPRLFFHLQQQRLLEHIMREGSTWRWSSPKRSCLLVEKRTKTSFMSWRKQWHC